MMIFKKIKENLFLFLLLITYIVLFIINPNMSKTAIKNSAFYIKEMLFIMPVIFLLTALLDMWVSKEKIMQLLGKDAGIKGVFLSFLLGSISAGPIYAAFPMCVMLRKKGASIRNIIIILSSWAVIKIPMLLNELKFLGPKFTIVRYILTVISILIFSLIANKLIKDEDIKLNNQVDNKGLKINQNACMGCTICAKTYSDIFEMKGKKAYVREIDMACLDESKVKEVVNLCPCKAIDYEE